MNPETKTFLDQVRDAEGPSAESEQRVLRAVHATVALEAAAGATASAAANSHKLSTLSSATVVKASVIGLVFVGASMTIFPRKEAEPVHSRAASTSVIARGGEAPPATSIPEAKASQVSEIEASSVRLSLQEPPIQRPPANLSVGGRAARASQTSDLRGELTLLSKVRAALQRGDGASALHMLDAHVTADRQLLSERQVARVLALCAVGRQLEAQRSAEAFLRQHPSSPHRAAIAGSCAAGKTD